MSLPTPMVQTVRRWPAKSRWPSDAATARTATTFTVTDTARR